MKPRALIFDLDGTLHDKRTSDAQLGTHLWAQHHLEEYGVDRRAWTLAFGVQHALPRPKPEVFAELATQFALPSPLAEELTAAFDRDYARHVLPMPGADAMLRSARDAGWKLGVVTNGRDAFQRGKIAGLGWTERFDVILTSGAFGRKKPDSEIFRAALVALGSQAADTIMIGDDLTNDVVPAAALGMRAIWKSRAHDQRAVFCSESLDEIRQFLFSPASETFARNTAPS